jgi:hypothetical protein
MPDELLIEIIDLCWRIDRAAHTLYERFAAQTDDRDLAEFWRGVASDERAHLAYWDALRERVATQPFPPLFEAPEWTIGGLHRSVQRAEELIAHAEPPLTTEQMIRAALRMEFYLSHPAFEALFLLSYDDEPDTPAKHYEHHIGSFVAACRRFAPTADLELLAEVLVWAWRSNRLAAERLAEIGQLQRLLPMCASCHKVRRSSGEWQPVDDYLARRHHLDVSHGMCPDCVAEHYPDFSGGSDGD